jgi:cell division cycle 20, cofactor of APC complex
MYILLQRQRPPKAIALNIDLGRRLSRRQSRHSFSRASSIGSSMSGPSTPSRSQASFNFMPQSDSSDRPFSPVTHPFPETSARFFLKNSKITIDFTGCADGVLGMTWPMALSQRNILVFGRGNRVHLKNLTINEDIVGLAKVKDGHLRLLECGGEDLPNAIALATSKGLIQIWDITAKKMTTSWETKPVTSMTWNGPVLTVGGEKGSIRHFDTRIKDAGKMKDQTKRVLRHQARITSLAWNHDGKVLASGDEGGMVYCWDSRQNAPLDVGDLIQRRRKMHHTGAVRVSRFL